MTFSFSIGILAHNEAHQITKTLDSLKQQSIFQPGSRYQHIEVMVVPNGCTDRTEAVAQHNFASADWLDLSPAVECRVVPIAQAGKSNAWNTYVHELARPEAKYIFLMDADIEFYESRTLERMLDNLESKPQAWVAIDQPIKDVQLQPSKNLMESMSSSISDQDSSSTAITGQLYCARAQKLRQIWMPQGLAVEDGFLRAMILTDRFTEPENLDRITYTEGASHIYESYKGIRSILRHEKRIVIGTIVNQFIFDYFWQTCTQELDAGTLVRQNNQHDPNWVHRLIAQSRQDRGWWLLNEDHTFRRLDNLKRYSGFKTVKRLPIEVAASFADWLVFYNANREIHQGNAIGYW